MCVQRCIYPYRFRLCRKIFKASIRSILGEPAVRATLGSWTRNIPSFEFKHVTSNAVREVPALRYRQFPTWASRSFLSSTLEGCIEAFSTGCIPWHASSHIIIQTTVWNPFGRRRSPPSGQFRISFCMYEVTCQLCVDTTPHCWQPLTAPTKCCQRYLHTSSLLTGCRVGGAKTQGLRIPLKPLPSFIRW